MKCKLHSCSRRTKKWWYKMFYYLVDVSVVNSHVIMLETPNITTMSLKNFMIKVARELMASYSSWKRSPNPSGFVPLNRFCKRHFPAKSENTGQCQVCDLCRERKRIVFNGKTAPVTLSTCALYLAVKSSIRRLNK